MYAEMTCLQQWLRVETNNDCQFIPNDLCGLTQEDVDQINEKLNGPSPDSDSVPAQVRDYIGGSRLMDDIELIEGYGIRSSMPGYMDCTDWDVYTDLAEAEEAFRNEQEMTGELEDGEYGEGFDDDVAKDEQEG